MPLPTHFPVPDLDDRRFDELVAELQARLARHVPEMAPLAPTIGPVEPGSISHCAPHAA